MFQDRLIWLSLAAGGLVLALLRLQLGSGVSTVQGLLPVFSFVLWQPLLEELLFRGLLQGQIRRFQTGRLAFGGISLANALTGLCFVCLHLLNHSPGLALAVLLPSLLFGFFRDRHGSIAPGLFLHVLFNAGYLIAGLP
jgi:membrane protease YdiL (CAAX protease family)